MTDPLLELIAAKTAAVSEAALHQSRDEFELQRDDVRRLIESIAGDHDAVAALIALAAIPYRASEASTVQAMMQLLTELERLMPAAPS